MAPRKSSTPPESSPDIPEELLQKVRSELLSRISIWLVGGLLGLLALAVVGWWTVLKPAIINEIGGVPEGAVVAFVTPCAGNWAAYQEATARFIVGAGDPASESARGYGVDEAGHPLTLKPVGLPGGVSEVSFKGSDLAYYIDPVEQEGGFVMRTEPGAFSLPIKARVREVVLNNLPPYVALHFCKKK